MTMDATDLESLGALLDKIRGYDDPRRAAAEWKQAYRLLQKADLPSGRVNAVVGMRDVAGLAELVCRVGAPADSQAQIDPETLKKAYEAFRKRLKLTVLDEQSTLGRSPLTKGAGSAVAVVAPPVEWPAEVWQELVRQGKLRYAGGGLYALKDK